MQGYMDPGSRGGACPGLDPGRLAGMTAEWLRVMRNSLLRSGPADMAYPLAHVGGNRRQREYGHHGDAGIDEPAEVQSQAEHGQHQGRQNDLRRRVGLG